MIEGIGARRRRHIFAGFDRVGYACAATCTCGWTGKMERADERAILAFSGHCVGSWIPKGRRRP